MTALNQKTSKLIDNLIFVFSVIFLLTLTNSIFLNQLGYYGILLSLLLKYYTEKKNPFSKTGLEFALLFFILALILSTIFSIDRPTSVYNLLKRFFLIPTLYTFVVAPKDFKNAKQFVIIYLSAALLTMMYYLIKSYDYFVNNLYQIKGSGPSVFQYPITSSELMTFSLVILFAFLINEKCKFKYKILVFVLFMINLLALIATYKRTGWMGAAAGMLFILILSRKWVLLLGVVILGIVFSLLNKTVSQVYVYKYYDSMYKNEFLLNTDGKALNVYEENNSIYVSDYENGLLILQDSSIIKKIKLAAPITDFKKWRDNFYIASSADTRFVLLEKYDKNNFKIRKEFFTNGAPLSSVVANNLFYVLEEDSGLTVFNDPNDLKNKITIKTGNFVEQQDFFVDSNLCAIVSKERDLSIYSLKNFLPDKLLLKEKIANDEELIGMVDQKFIFNSPVGVKLYSFVDEKLNLEEINNKLGNISFIKPQKQSLFICSTRGEVFELKYPVSNKLEIISSFNLGFTPQSIYLSNGKIYATFSKTSRLGSVIDPYFPTNYSRFAFWRAGLKIFQDYPIFGVGDIDLAELYKVYKQPYDREIQGHLHSIYFHTLTTLGAFGFLTFIFLLGMIFIVLWRTYRQLKNLSFASSFSLGAIGGYAAFLVAGITEYNFGDHEVITMVWFTLAISLSFKKNFKIENTVR